jgi:ankyrin repeat protein
MNARNVLLAFAVLLFTAGCAPLIHAQQQNSKATTEQEFFDAIIKGNSARVGELLKQQPSLMKATYKKGITPILLARYAHHPEIAEMLLATGVEPNFFEAAATGRVERLREFLKKDPELVHAWTPDGWTALHLNFNNAAVAKLLIDAGADVNVNSRNKLNATPLQGAAANNWLDLARLYLSRGANVNCRSEGGGSPLHEAAANGLLEFAKLLVESGADVNQKDDSGKTPLTFALEYKHPEVAQFLREHGGVQ